MVISFGYFIPYIQVAGWWKILLIPQICERSSTILKGLPIVQENCSTPLEHTPNNPPSQLWKESFHSLLVKVARGVFHFGVVIHGAPTRGLWPPMASSATVGEDILNVQANARLAAHLREEPALHILEEDAEPYGRIGRWWFHIFARNHYRLSRAAHAYWLEYQGAP